MTATTEEVLYKVVIKGTMDEVWREVTRTDRINPVFFNMKMDTTTLGPGAPIRMRTRSGKHTGVVGEVLEFDPPHRFVHTFKFTNFDDPACTVVYDLKEVQDGVEFTLRVENLATGTRTARQMAGGARMIANTLKSMVETGKPSIGTRSLFMLFKVMEPFSPKSTRSEHWPL